VIEDLALRWAVTALFGASIAGELYVLVAQRERWICTVERLLHLLMSAAMIVMAWPAGMDFPTVGPMVFFLAAAVWFVLVAAHVFSDSADRLINGYHATMMAAVAWLYAVMSGGLPGQHSPSPEKAMSGSAGMNMPGMDMPGMDMPAHQMHWCAAQPGWITTINWIAAVGFACAAVYWLYRYFTGVRKSTVRRTALADVGPLYQAFMAAGMVIMFGVML
jgi:hypothetical protein